MVVFLECTASLGVLGHQGVMVVMAATDPKVTGEVQEKLDHEDHQEPLVSMEITAPKENLESGALPAQRGSAERVGSLGLMIDRFIRTGKSVHGKT